jgi:hypothetical protein
MEICRICQEDDYILNLISPCKCHGSIKYIHSVCLNAWINSSKQNKCAICNILYKYEIHMIHPKIYRQNPTLLITSILYLKTLFIIFIALHFENILKMYFEIERVICAIVFGGLYLYIIYKYIEPHNQIHLLRWSIMVVLCCVLLAVISNWSLKVYVISQNCIGFPILFIKIYNSLRNAYYANPTFEYVFYNYIGE